MNPQKPLSGITLICQSHQNCDCYKHQWEKACLKRQMTLPPDQMESLSSMCNTGSFTIIRLSWWGLLSDLRFLTLLTSLHSGDISRFNNQHMTKFPAGASAENVRLKRNADYNATKKSSWSSTVTPIYPAIPWTINQKPWLKDIIDNREDAKALSRICII